MLARGAAYPVGRRRSCITNGVHPRTPEMILAEREALQRRASAEDRVVARRRGTDGETRHYRRSAGATSS